MLDLEEEKKILNRFKKGDSEAFGKLYDVYAPKIYRFARLKVNSQETAQDLTSEAFLKVLRYLQEERKIKERFQSLLYKITRNLIIDFYRRRSNREILVEDNLQEFSGLKNDETGETLAVKREEIGEIKKALVRIHSNYQDIIVWYYLDELSIAEIADVLEKSEGAVRVLIHRALKALRQELPN